MIFVTERVLHVVRVAYAPHHERHSEQVSAAALEIAKLPSGSLRVKVYGGIDPLSGRRLYLTETIPAGPTAHAEAKQAHTRLQNQVDEQRNPLTKATVNQLMNRYLELLDVEVTTRKRYEDSIQHHIRPLLGDLQVGKLNGETLDSFHAILRRCRAHCDGRPFIEHRVDGPHECTKQCQPHVCRPLSTASIRKVHFCLSGALKRAVRWRWISVNPLELAEPPRSAKHDPHPPTSEQAAAILNTAFADVAWGVLLWLAMTTGARRGELCALRWDLLDLDKAARDPDQHRAGRQPYLGERHQDPPAAAYRPRREHGGTVARL